MKNSYRLRVVLLALATGVSCFPVMAAAQDHKSDASPTTSTNSAASGSKASAKQKGGLEVITVTARRKTENLQDVPVAVTAINTKQIQRYGLTSLEKISALTPQFTVGRASNGSGAELTLRGIGSSSTSIGIEQSVAVILNGVYYGQGRVINDGFLDLDSVQILKGPQALFFGKNATAGVISLKSALPTPYPEYMARIGYEMNGENLSGEMMASGPLTDKLGIRVAVRGSKMFGYYFANGGLDKTYSTYDIATGTVTPHFAPALTSNNPGTRELLGRITLQYKPTDDLTMILRANTTISNDENNSWNYVPYGCANPNGTFGLNPAIKCSHSFTVYQNFFPKDLAGTNPFSRSDGGLYNRYRAWAVTGTIKDKIKNINLTWITNYNKNINQWACDCTFVSAPDPLSAPSTEHSLWHSFSSEFRAETSYAGPLNLMVGFLYQKTKRNHTQTGSFGGVSDSNAPPAFRYLGYYKRSETSGETLSAYSEVTWDIVPKLELAGGARYTHETKDSYLVQPYVNGALQFLFPQNKTISANQVWDNWSPEATLTWRPTTDITIYGAYKTAYKSGGFSNSGFVSASTVTNDVAFNPETAAGFEGGVKTMLFDRQLRFNVDVYTYKYSNLQVDFFNAATFAFITTNAGAARTKGVEMEFEFAPRVLAGFNLHGSLNYNHARYTDYIAPCYGGQTLAEGCGVNGLTFQGAPAQDLSGKPTAVAPGWTGSLGVSYEQPVSNMLKAGLSIDTRYSGSYLASSFDKPNSLQKEYLSVDATANITTIDGRYRFSVIGKNLTNQFIVGGAVDAPNSPGDTIGFVNMPRTVKFQVTVRF